MTVELPLVTGWLLPWDPVRLRKLIVLGLESILEGRREVYMSVQTFTCTGPNVAMLGVASGWLGVEEDATSLCKAQ